MDDEERIERLNEIAERFSIPVLGTNALSGKPVGPPFDISKPNQHDNKTDFRTEQAIVNEALSSTIVLTDLLGASVKSDAENHDVAKSIRERFDRVAKAQGASLPVETLYDLVHKNATQHDTGFVLLLLLFDFKFLLMTRKQELSDQEQEFWSGNSRPPNHYARTIALRFARAVSRSTGEKPTFGTARDGGHPSTDFGRALEEIFEILDINASIARPAKWAIDQLELDDLIKRTSPKGSFGGLKDGQHPLSDANFLATLAARRLSNEN